MISRSRNPPIDDRLEDRRPVSEKELHLKEMHSVTTLSKRTGGE